MTAKIHGYITLGILATLLLISGAWYASSSIVKSETLAEKAVVLAPLPLHTGNYVLVNLKEMTVKLRNGTTTLETMDIVSVGKPGNYYETIGGSFVNDYKIRLHYSSIGHVYMPYSVHVFGNFFIHAIPYFPGGKKVSTAYSGGCVRLEDIDAKKVYDFVEKGTPIIITQNGEYDFTPTATSTPTIEDMDMTRIMVATILLELLDPEIKITGLDGKKIMYLELMPDLLTQKNDAVSTKYAKRLGEKNYVDYMNQRAHSLGLTNTTFTGIKDSAQTTPEDLARFMDFIAMYKSYMKPLYSPKEQVSL